ncbi:MAG: DNA phosphorothioation-associated protein 4 [Gudongella sp.]|jgi:dnd system-associated protein 4|nr:DNA phosphorothioation-associated protein 4 [Gudongella sp.]
MPELPSVSMSAEQYDIIQNLSNISRSLFPTMKDLVIFAAILGFSEGRKTSFTSKTKDPIKGHTFERYQDDDIIFWIALGETKDPSILQPNREKECVEIFEEYACGGIEIIEGWCNKNALLSKEQAIISELQKKGYFPLNEKDKAPDLSDVEL